MSLDLLDRKTIQKIGKVVADTRYDVSFDVRTSTQNIIDYIETQADILSLTEDSIEVHVHLPSVARRIISFKEKRGRKTDKQ